MVSVAPVLLCRCGRYKSPDETSIVRREGVLGSRPKHHPQSVHCLVEWVEGLGATDEHFFVDIERAFLDPGESLSACAVNDMSNLQVMPDGSAYRCGAVADSPEMSTMAFSGSALTLRHRGRGEDSLGAGRTAREVRPQTPSHPEQRRSQGPRLGELWRRSRP